MTNIGAATLNLWGCHGDRPRRAGLAGDAARFVEELAGSRGGVHVILSGDFDATPDAASMRFWRGEQSLDGMSICYRDAWPPGFDAHTFTPENPLVCGDHGGVWASDHFGVVADLCEIELL